MKTIYNRKPLGLITFGLGKALRKANEILNLKILLTFHFIRKLQFFILLFWPWRFPEQLLRVTIMVLCCNLLKCKGAKSSWESYVRKLFGAVELSCYKLVQAIRIIRPFVLRTGFKISVLWAYGALNSSGRTWGRDKGSFIVTNYYEEYIVHVVLCGFDVSSELELQVTGDLRLKCSYGIYIETRCTMFYCYAVLEFVFPQGFSKCIPDC